MVGELETIFSQAIALPDSQLPDFLDRACEGNPELRGKLDLLLRHRSTLATNLLIGMAGFSLLTTPSEILPIQLERYELQSRIGEGAFGVVYRAVQHTPVKRNVAVKVLRPGLASAQVVARFEAERQALAALDHPNVAHLFDAGNMPDGRPFFVMELLDGLPLTEYCDRHHLDLPARLRLFRKVCTGVEHAHRRGIIHRDLKPSNILASDLDGVAHVKVIDFGIARALETESPFGSLATEAGRLMGTPEYMSSEQIDGGASDVDTRADVYALGVLLYELLCGRLPFDSKRLRSSRLSELRRIICEDAPPPPSEAWGDDVAGLAAAAANRGTTSAHLIQTLKREIEWVPLRALRKSSSDRYSGTAPFADDVNNYLAGKPLLAGPDSAAYRTRKFVQRHRPSVATAATILLLLVLAIVGTTVEMISARRAQAKATLERDTAELQLAATKVVSGQYATDRNKFVDAWDAFLAARQIELAHGKSALPADFGLYSVLAKADPPAAILESAEAGMPWLKFLDDGKELISSGPANSIEWDLNSSRRVREFPFKIVAVSADSQTLFTRDDSTITARDRRTLEPRVTFEHDPADEFGRFTLSPDGRWLVGCHIYKYFSVWDTATGKRVGKYNVSETEVHNVVFSPNGDRAYVAGGESAASVWDTGTWTEIGKLPHTHYGLLDLAVSPDGMQLAIAGWDKQASIIDLKSRRIVRTFPQQDREITGVAFSQDGKSLITCSTDASVRSTDIATGETLRFMFGHRMPVQAVAYSPDDERFATASLDGEIRIWNSHSPQVSFDVTAGLPRIVYELPFSSDDRLFIPMPARQTGEAEIWDTVLRKKIGAIDLHGITLGSGLTFSPDLDRIIAVEDGETPGTLFEWNVAGGRRHSIMDLDHAVRGVMFDQTQERMVSFGDIPGIKIWNLPTKQLLWKRDNRVSTWSSAQLSPDGLYLSIETNDGIIEIVRVDDGVTIRKIHTVENPIGFAATSFVPGHPDQLIWSHELDTRPRLINFLTGEQIWITGEQQREKSGWCLTGDAKMVMVGNGERQIDFVDIENGQNLFNVVLPEAVTRYALSPRMSKLAYLTHDNQLRIADLTMGPRLAGSNQLRATDGKLTTSGK